jgi:archaellum component FlaG (FlaF/FlaG flagellin family)
MNVSGVTDWTWRTIGDERYQVFSPSLENGAVFTFNVITKELTDNKLCYRKDIDELRYDCEILNVPGLVNIEKITPRTYVIYTKQTLEFDGEMEPKVDKIQYVLTEGILYRI